MLYHYIKIAFRNLLKYKLQSFICIVGLAIGFTSFALSSLWIRYELTYDTFRKDADRIYYVRVESETDDQGLSSVTPYPLARYLKETFPEIEESCNTSAWKTDFLYNEKKYESFDMVMDSAAEHMFEIELISGSRDFMIPKSNKIAITDKLAKEVFGTKDPLGEKLKIWSDDMEICAIVKSQDQHSNFPFGILKPSRQTEEWNVAYCQTFIKVRPETDMRAFKKKLYEHKVKKDRDSLNHFVLTSITAMRYDHPEEEPTIKFEHILLFALAGGLVILCALFNYLTLFVNRIRIRSKEIGLRKVCGSSDGNLFVLFASEYLLTLSISLLAGIALIEVILPVFQELNIDFVIQGHDHIYEVMGPINNTTKTIVPGSVTNVELVSPDSNKNPKGQQGGTFNVKDGTLYFVNGTCGRKRYYPYTQDEMEAGFDKHKVEGYWDLFTGKYGQPGAPAFSEISVSSSEIEVKTYTSDANAQATLFDTFKIVKNGNTGIEENKQSAKLYPTYAKDKINTTESDIIRVNAIDLTGKIYPLPFDNQHIDVSNLTDGIYVVQIFTNEKTRSERIVKTSR